MGLLKVVSGQKPREIAVRVLERRQGVDFVEDLLENALARARLSLPDRHLCQQLVYGIVRWQMTLDWLIARKTKGRAQKPLLQNLLRLGLYQIFWLDRIPNHAAVHETVELARSSGLVSQSGFLNAVLRRYLRAYESTRQLLADLKKAQPHLGYSHPQWLVARWQRRWGQANAQRLMEWNNTPPKTFARFNTLKAEPATLLAHWRDEKVEYDVVHHPWFEKNLVFELKAHPPLDGLPSFQQGWFYVQDPSSLLAPRELNPHPGETVLDLCAAPGGKLTYIAQLMRNQGHLVARDISPRRLKLIEENCARLGVTCVQAMGRGKRAEGRGKREGQRAEGLRSPLSALRSSLSPLHPSHFDGILIDAPCSNTGVMRRRVEVRWRIGPEEIARLCAIQLDLLREAAPLLKPGGRLVYSTCSLELEENQEIVQQFVQEHRDFKLQQERELLPFVEAVDGAYVAVLERSA